MTKEEFVEQKLKPKFGTESSPYRSMEDFNRRRVILPCACTEPECPGWAIVDNNPEEIKKHNEEYAPGGLYAKGS